MPTSSGAPRVLESAVSDTGPVLHLAEIAHIEHYRLFGCTSISQQVKSELRRLGILRILAETLGDRLQIVNVTADEVRRLDDPISSTKLHPADLSTLALAVRLRPDVVLTDDLALRRRVEDHGFVAVGSIGILVRAHRTGRLTRSQLEEALDKLLNGSSLYTSKAFRARVDDILKNTLP
jgi:predicted nucleic acid-binding protein